MGLLIDSTALIAAERHGRTPAEFVEDIERRWGDQILAISVVSAAEMLHGCWRAETPARRAKRESFVEDLLSSVPVVALSLETARVVAEIGASLGARGVRIPTSDLWIGCTALSRGDDVLTGNVRHFASIPGLQVRVPSAEVPS